MRSFEGEPLKYSYYLSPSLEYYLGLSQKQVFFLCVVRDSTLLKAMERNVNYLSQTNCRGHRWNLKSKSQLGAPEARKLSRELDNQLIFQGVS